MVAYLASAVPLDNVEHRGRFCEMFAVKGSTHGGNGQWPEALVPV